MLARRAVVVDMDYGIEAVATRHVGRGVQVKEAAGEQLIEGVPRLEEPT